MPRTSRMMVSDEKAVYHVMSRIALDGFPLKDVEKEFMLGLFQRFAAVTPGVSSASMVGKCVSFDIGGT